MTQQIRVQASTSAPESVIRDGIDVVDLGLTLIGREYTTSLGRIDILTVDEAGAPVPIEVKLGEAGDSAVGQVLGYMSAVGASRGVIVAKTFSKRVEAISKAASIDLVQYVVAPSKEVVVSNMTMKLPLAHASFDDAVLNMTHQDRDMEEVVKTSIYLPQWVCIAAEIIHLRSNMPVYKLYTGMITYGSALMQHRFGDELEAHQQVRGTLLESGGEFKAGFLYDFKSLGDVMFVKPRRRSVRIPEWCVKYLGSFSGAFPIEYSATIRLSIAYALMKNEVTNPCKENCVCETESFERGLNEYMQVIGIL